MVQPHSKARRQVWEAENARIAQEAARRTQQAQSDAAARKAAAALKKMPTKPSNSGRAGTKRAAQDDEDVEEANARPAKKQKPTPAPARATAGKKRNTKKSEAASTITTTKADAKSSEKQTTASAPKRAAKRTAAAVEESENEDEIIEQPAAKKAKTVTKREKKAAVSKRALNKRKRANRSDEEDEDPVEAPTLKRTKATPTTARKQSKAPAATRPAEAIALDVEDDERNSERWQGKSETCTGARDWGDNKPHWATEEGGNASRGVVQPDGIVSNEAATEAARNRAIMATNNALFKILVTNTLSATELQDLTRERDRHVADAGRKRKELDVFLAILADDSLPDDDRSYEEASSSKDGWANQIREHNERVQELNTLLPALERHQKRRNARLYVSMRVYAHQEPFKSIFDRDLMDHMTGLWGKFDELDDARWESTRIDLRETELNDDIDERRWQGWNAADSIAGNLREPSADQKAQRLHLAIAREGLLADADLKARIEPAEQALYAAEPVFYAAMDRALTAYRNREEHDSDEEL